MFPSFSMKILTHGPTIFFWVALTLAGCGPATTTPSSRTGGGEPSGKQAAAAEQAGPAVLPAIDLRQLPQVPHARFSILRREPVGGRGPAEVRRRSSSTIARPWKSAAGSSPSPWRKTRSAMTPPRPCSARRRNRSSSPSAARARATKNSSRLAIWRVRQQQAAPAARRGARLRRHAIHSLLHGYGGRSDAGFHSQYAGGRWLAGVEQDACQAGEHARLCAGQLSQAG